MARQGKMHSSPFHIETASYKYAIEHESDDCVSRSSAIDCKHIVSNHNCNLWNSGFTKCMSFKCRHYQKIMQRVDARCSLCAFYFEKNCHHPHKPLKDKAKGDAALYCCFYICETEKSTKYHRIASDEHRHYLKVQLDIQRKVVARRQKQISDAEKEMLKLDPSSTEYAYLQTKIATRKKALQQAETTVEQIRSKLERLGGELREQPSKKNKKAKNGKSSRSNISMKNSK